MDRLDLTLPSGTVVRVRAEGEGAPVADDTVDGKRMFAGRMLRALAQGRVVVERRDGDAWLSMQSGEIDALSLEDFHALRDAAYRVGAITDDPDEDFRCRNCEARLEPGREDAPLAEMDRWYVEQEPEPFEPPFPLGTKLPLGGNRTADSFVLEPVTVARAKPLWRALMRESGGVTPRVVAGLGIVSLGEVTDRRVIARALDAAPGEVWSVLETAFLWLNYAPRSYFPYVCPSCGTLHDLPAPAAREFAIDPDAEAVLAGGERPDVDGAEPFPDEDAFAEMVLRIGREVYRDRGVRNIELVVNTDVPPVDGSGEPLMGSYQPIVEGDAAGYTQLRFQIDVYYRTFEKMYAEAPFDLEAEVRETIDHEVEHHLHYLSGHDPMDEHEREEALAELKRTYGARTVRRARVAGVLTELRTFAWFLLAALAAVAALAAFC